MTIDSVVIGFGHRARSGKDTAVAEIIAQRGAKRRIDLPYVPGEPFSGTVGFADIRRYAFADALRQEVNQAYLSAGGWRQLFGTWEFMQHNGNFVELPEWVRQGYEEDPEINEQYPFGKQRTLLQWWGTEYRRSVEENYWVRQLAEQIEKEKPAYALITDCRFPNEFAWVQSVGGKTVRVDRKDLPAISTASHASETALAGDFPWDYILTNDGTLEEFKEGALTLFDDIATSFAYGHGV